MLFTVLGEFVLPAGGEVWTSSLVVAADALGIGEKNARQALSRIGDQGLVRPDRHGRRVRWSLTGAGRRLLETGAERIYGFGTTDVDWDGRWLVVHCPVVETKRQLRNRLRTQLAFLGFGELSANLLVSPHTTREPELRRVLADLELSTECIILRSTISDQREQAGLVGKAWNLNELAAAYERFELNHDTDDPGEPEHAFRAVVSLVDDWRRFPFIDPELPTTLLPAHWAGHAAADFFHDRRRRWSPAAREWFDEHEPSEVSR